MGAQWSRNFINIETRFKVMPDRLLDCIEGKMREALEFGKESMVDTVETSGTGYQGRRGRVVTGEMRDEIAHQQSRSKDRITGFLGWLEGTPLHARFQELGFTHALSGKDVEGMKALANAREEVWQEFREGCEDCLREVARG